MHTPHVIPLATATPPKSGSAPPRPSSQHRSGPKPDEGGGLRILTYLRLHWLMITFCGTLLGGGAAYAAWELLDSKYESYGLFQVSSIQPTVASAGNREQARTDFVTYLKTTSTLMKSEFVLNAALRDMKDLPTIKAQKDPMKFLDEELVVTWQDGSEVIRISFKSHEPVDAKRIVDAVQDAFVKEVVQKDIKEKRIFLDQVEKAMQDMRKILDRKSEKDRPMVAKAATPTEPATTIPAGGVPPGGIPNVMPAGGPGAMPPALPPIGPDGVAAGPLPPLPGVPPAGQPGNENLLNRIDPRIVVSRYSGLMQEADRLPLQINDGKRRLVVLQQKMEAIKTAPISQLTIDAVEKDGDVIVEILKTSIAKRDYEFRLRTGEPDAPGVVQLRQAWESHEARLVQLRKEKAEIIESSRRIAEAQRIAAEMEDLIRSLQRLQEQYDPVGK
jgi:polysaccharide biosynthesis transport protein